jgi:ATP-dependent protease ClpP protease subunit
VKVLIAAVVLLSALRTCAGEPRVVSLEGPIDDEAAQRVRDGVKDARAGEPVLVRIESFGGSVSAGFEVVRLLEQSGADTTCEVGAVAASMAAIILESPGCRHRVLRPWSVLMFHGVSAEPADRVSERDARALVGMLAALNLSVARMVAPRVGLTEQEYLARVASEWWVVGSDAGRAADEVRP